MILLNSGQARAFDALVRERLSLSERALIERAGSAAAALLRDRCSGLAGKRIAVFCGKGNNAADGLVLAREAALQGAGVGVVLAFPEPDLGPQAAWALGLCRAAGLRVEGPDKAATALQSADLAVDALVGTGTRLPLAGNLALLVRALEAFQGRVLSLDLPSGLDADTGDAPGACVRATWTLTFLAAKLGLALGEGPARCGELNVAGLGAEEAWAAAPAAELFDPAAARGALVARPAAYHKKRAELLVVAGSTEYLGAALLCARGAYRCGAGLVRLALPQALAPFAQSALPEAVVHGLPCVGAPGTDELQALLDLAQLAGAVVVGPGLGRRPETQGLVRELWARIARPAVFDADALNALELGRAPGGPRILTPHEGELKAMRGAGALDKGRPAAARALAAAASAVVLLKGPASLCAGPDGTLSVNSEGSSVLATAGTGDVLSGAIGALLCQGTAPFPAAALGAWLHGRASALWAGRHGGRGMLASDLADALPDALARIAS
ncbi:MAG TPA: NAD(P)H-hydrate dehydratase [bacterium]|jgi:hydroxyethylthiazole kinase-like uncharacterized protein yjeF|nr:NAD(P)H-hydrate dehydratase [bacterium]